MLNRKVRPRNPQLLIAKPLCGIQKRAKTQAKIAKEYVSPMLTNGQKIKTNLQQFLSVMRYKVINLYELNINKGKCLTEK